MILRQGSGFSAEGEHCPPPTWFHLRDRKYGYDVSVPLRAAGYMSMLGFSKTARHVMERLKEIGRQSFASYMKRMEDREALVRSGNILPKDLYGKMESEVRKGTMNYPQATLEMMGAMLTFSAARQYTVRPHMGNRGYTGRRGPPSV